LGEKSLSFSYKAEQNFKGKTMAQKSILALVVSNSGAFQNGLLALMTTIPAISAVLVAEDTISTLRMIDNHQPALIIMDMSLHKVQDVMKQIKTQWPHIHLIVLADDITQGKEMEALGADHVLIKGFPPQKLVEVIDDFAVTIETN
jgi:DNA-binding NarL/FixJ family response regulator